MGIRVDVLRQRIREEARIEGPDGGGISSTFITKQIDNAVTNLSELYAIRSTLTFQTVADQNEYDIDTLFSDIYVENLLRVQYDDRKLGPMGLEEFEQSMLDEGFVRGWVLWGRSLILLGEVEAKEVKLWITRLPLPVVEDSDEVELPNYTEEAISQYVISACYREMNRYERAAEHYRLFLRERTSLANRAIPQGQRARANKVIAEYSQAERSIQTTRRSDTNPGGGL